MSGAFVLSLAELEKCGFAQKTCQPVISLTPAQQLCLLNNSTRLRALAAPGEVAKRRVVGEPALLGDINKRLTRGGPSAFQRQMRILRSKDRIEPAPLT